ncbi:hypothetical protein B9G98_02068 [Wickerhamiella sorbophila]|uniref:Trafficking protein particle complex subunit 11 n=1 Tax=Wickerhamiella sorbophila TaxID=45607 RepID=A0A2T0FHH0_9ASCO|nr:hypothetical protein B9G98_02068 [Wickerhamiella sorbophila]PRT54448.1 hypothetical protein B9G98_02068 [Wickerhamiella sorbophila]
MDLHFVPLVLVGGLGGKPDEKQTPLSIQSVDLADDVRSNPALDVVKAALLARSYDTQPWIEPVKLGSPILHLKLCNEAFVYVRGERPSILSPKNKESSLFPDGLFTYEWVRKYSEYWPSTAVVFYEYTNQTDLQELGSQITQLKTKLTALDIRLVAIVTSTEAVASADLESAVAELRWSTGLAPRTGMLMLPPDANDVETSVFVETLWLLLGTNSADFFANRAREVRYKRDRLTSETASLRWDARYTLKLAIFSEFKYDVRGALRLYESAYDCVRQLFDNGLEPNDASAWCAARELLDTIALKVAKHALYLKDASMASKKYRYHLHSVTHLLQVQQLPSTPAWRAFNYFKLANLVKNATLNRPVGAFYPAAPGLSSALPRAGLLYLDAAKAATEPPVDMDPYKVVNIDVIEALNSAYTDLRPFPHTAGHALQMQAEYLLSLGEKAAALDAYERALPLLHPGWPQKATVARQILQLSSDDVQKATAQLALLATGESVELEETTRELGRFDTSLFDVEGTFHAQSGYLGRKVVSQITLHPKFNGTLRLATIKAIFTGKSVSIEHAESADPELDVYASGDANLVFSGGKPKTFELSMSVSEPGEVTMESVHIFGANPVFLQECKVKSAHVWLQHPVSSKTTRHLQLPNPREIEILSRKAQVAFEFDTFEKVAPQEKAACYLTIINNETEVSHVKLQVYLDEEGLNEQMVHEATLDVDAQSKSIETFDYTAPPQGTFSLRVAATYHTDSDPMPVKASESISIDTSNMLRTTFDLTPQYHPDPWKNLFVPDGDDMTPKIARGWVLQVTVLPLIKDAQLHDVRVEFESEDAEIESLPRPKYQGSLVHNKPVRASFGFVSRRKSRDLRSFDGKASVIITWSRNRTQEISNEYVLPPLRLSLTHQEPRALCLARVDGGTVHLDYYVENSTSHILTFAVTMGTSSDFAVQGPKGGSLRLLPFSRRKLSYDMVVMNDKRAVLPLLRIFDTTYKRALTVLPGNNTVTKGPNGLHLNL